MSDIYPEKCTQRHRRPTIGWVHALPGEILHAPALSEELRTRRTLTRRSAGMSGRSAHPCRDSPPLLARHPMWSSIDTGTKRPPWGRGRNVHPLDERRSQPVRRPQRRPADRPSRRPGLRGHPPLDAGRRPALGHDRRMATAQPSAAQRVTVEEDQTGTRGDAAFVGPTLLLSAGATLPTTAPSASSDAIPPGPRQPRRKRWLAQAGGPSP